VLGRRKGRSKEVNNKEPKPRVRAPYTISWIDAIRIKRREAEKAGRSPRNQLGRRNVVENGRFLNLTKKEVSVTKI